MKFVQNVRFTVQHKYPIAEAIVVSDILARKCYYERLYTTHGGYESRNTFEIRGKYNTVDLK